MLKYFFWYLILSSIRMKQYWAKTHLQYRKSVPTNISGQIHDAKLTEYFQISIRRDFVIRTESNGPVPINPSGPGRGITHGKTRHDQLGLVRSVQYLAEGRDSGWCPGVRRLGNYGRRLAFTNTGRRRYPKFVELVLDLNISAMIS